MTPAFTPVRLLILVSGSGSNAEKIWDYFKGHLRIQVVGWACNRRGAGAFDRAARLGAPIQQLNDLMDPQGEFANFILREQINGIVLAGFLQKIPDWLIDAFPGQILNIHPALLPKFGGKGMYGMHVHRAVLDAGETESGITIHEVNNRYDEGRIIAQFRCDVNSNQTPEDLALQIQKLEHAHFPEVVASHFEKLYRLAHQPTHQPSKKYQKP
jgi:phosphoribosylglycinamide formyltransferase-1